MQNISPLTVRAILSSEVCNTRTLVVGYQVRANATVFTRIRDTVVDIFTKKRKLSALKRKMHIYYWYGLPTPLLNDGLLCICKTEVVTFITTAFFWELGIQYGSTYALFSHLPVTHLPEVN